MSDSTTRQSVLFPDLFAKPVVVRFDQLHASSDGGALLLKAADRRLGLVDRLSACLRDERASGKVRHEISELFAQRMYGIACGYADANDAARLADDPIHKLLLGRDPIDGDALASQPTLSRFENAAGPRELYRMGVALFDAVIERHGKRLGRKVRKITVDFDPTDDPTHGAQQLSFFNGHYDCWCYLPILGFLTFNDEREEFLCAAVLRPGNATPKMGTLGLLARILDRLQRTFPKARILVRLDGGFACAELFEFLDEVGVDYVVAMGKNKVLERFAEKLMRRARRLSKKSGHSEKLYAECGYAAGKWDRARRVIFKAEVVMHPGRDPKDNPRFVVTNLKGDPQKIYERVYCARGEIENRIKELHNGLDLGRTSCSRFWANQLRVTLTAAAYVLMQEVRLKAAHTSYARAQVSTIREHLLKIGAWVEVSVRRIVLHLPASYPFLNEWKGLALSLGARAG